ncbi:MAG: hypothetical protein JWR78_4939 [Mycobacterium sp.]|jgi:hypothetical protein|nr:hypothetical protein [Mycobacterium sp.]
MSCWPATTYSRRSGADPMAGEIVNYPTARQFFWDTPPTGLENAGSAAGPGSWLYGELSG